MTAPHSRASLGPSQLSPSPSLSSVELHRNRPSSSLSKSRWQGYNGPENIPLPVSQVTTQRSVISDISASHGYVVDHDDGTLGPAVESKGNKELPLQPLGPVLSRVLTEKSIIVPRERRRGLLTSLALIPEVENPMEYTRRAKYLITAVVAIAGASAPMASAILFPALGSISRELHASRAITNMSVAVYMLGMAIFPLWWSSFAERVGYRTIYLISFAMYVISNSCAAVSIDISMLIVFRVFSGASAASAQTIGAGTIANIWEVKERGNAMGYFYLGPLCGPLLSPIIGGVLTNKFDWRSTQWFLSAFGALVLLLMVFCLPETFREKVQLVKEEGEVHSETEEGRQVILSRVSTHTKCRASQWVVALKMLLIDPLRCLKFMAFPPILITVYWASLAFCSLYILNVSIQKAFAQPPYNFSTLIIGLLYIPSSVGYILSSVLGGRWNDSIMRRVAIKRQSTTNNGTDQRDIPLDYRPEDRMGINAWVAGFMFPAALLVYGWVIQNGIIWPVPMLATFAFGVGSMLVFSVSTTMLTEFVPSRSASAVAVNNFFRNICSCVGGAIAEPLMVAIGDGWLFTVLAVLGFLSCSVVWIMQKFGPGWRSRAQKGEFIFL